MVDATLENSRIKTSAVVKADYDDGMIYIYVNGEQKRDYFSVVRYVLLSINHSFEAIGVKELIPCNCEECINKKNPYFYHYTTLIKFLQNKVNEIRCELSAKVVSIESLLDGMERTGAGKEDEILHILRKLQANSDAREAFLKRDNEIVMLKPNLFGLGVNINNLIKKFLLYITKKDKE